MTEIWKEEEVGGREWANWRTYILCKITQDFSKEVKNLYSDVKSAMCKYWLYI
jgi:hypothetical protein